MKRIIFAVVLVSGFLASSQGSAHHSFAAFDETRTIEVEGEIQEVTWANPHVRFSLLARAENGDETVWEIESTSLSIVGRLGLSRDDFAPGTVVTFAGWPLRSGAPMLTANNVLVGDSEFLLSPRSRPYFRDELANAETELFQGGTASQDQSIFRVWSQDYDDFESTPGGFWNTEFTLTEAAREAAGNFQADEGEGGQCVAKGMPLIMEQPYPMEFVQEDRNIVLRLEEFDTVRTIYMDGEEASRDSPDSILGRSWGEWDGNTLVVMTVDIRGWPYFNSTGIPQSEEMSLVERFTPTEDGSRLLYAMTVTDPQVFTEPFVLDRYYVWRPGEEVRPFNCIAAE